MNVLMVVLRLIHIFSGVFWAGASFFIISFVQPAVVATGAEGQKFMQQLALRSRFTAAMMGVAVLSSLSGLIMYWEISGFRAGWITSGYGLFLTLGGIAGLAAFGTGYYYQNRSIQRMKALGAAMQAAGGPPSPDQLAEMQSLAATVARGGQITSILLAVALVGMSVAQNVVF